MRVADASCAFMLGSSTSLGQCRSFGHKKKFQHHEQQTIAEKYLCQAV
jgi:hypothetical protein